jgi:hypothetical protein
MKGFCVVIIILYRGIYGDMLFAVSTAAIRLSASSIVVGSAPVQSEEVEGV